MRLQLALNVKDLDGAVEFYSKMFDVKVNKRKPGYANFAIDQPPLKLVLFENPEADERLNHLGVEVFDQSQVHEAITRGFRVQGLEVHMGWIEIHNREDVATAESELLGGATTLGSTGSIP